MSPQYCDVGARTNRLGPDLRKYVRLYGSKLSACFATKGTKGGSHPDKHSMLKYMFKHHFLYDNYKFIKTTICLKIDSFRTKP
jgi:hypothetical protein